MHRWPGRLHSQKAYQPHTAGCLRFLVVHRGPCANLAVATPFDYAHDHTCASKGDQPGHVSADDGGCHRLHQTHGPVGRQLDVRW